MAKPAPAPLPAVTPQLTSYRVRPGDSLSRLAACSGASVAEIANGNQISDPDLLFAGERLQLPQGHRCAVARSDSRAPTRAAARASDPAARASAERLLATANERLDAADFETSLANAAGCVQALESAEPDASAAAMRVRCHVVAGMAAAGLGRRDHAIDEFRRAYALDPDLELAPDEISPRIVELMSAARPIPSP